MENLKCSKCKQEKPASEFPGFGTGRPGYRCKNCSTVDRLRARYRNLIQTQPIADSETDLARKQLKASIFAEELERFKSRAAVAI